MNTQTEIAELNRKVAKLEGITYSRDYSPATNWRQGGPIIEREAIKLTPFNFGESWDACYPQWRNSETCEGETILIAALKCYVINKQLKTTVEPLDKLID